jgi:lipopolysaccharide export system protein LptA
MRPLVRVSRLILAVLALMLAAEARAQSQTGSFGDYKMDAKKPVDIQADWLEVDDKKQVATFRGNVVAKQGDYTIRAKELIVVYTSAQQKKPPAGQVEQAAAKTAGQPGADIKFIEVKGNVAVTSARDNQNAKANNGTFDVKAQTITLFDDVVVSKDKNVIKGERLLIDLAAGKSTFIGNEMASVAPDPNSPNPKQRLRMMITPQNVPGAPGHKAQEPAVPGGWKPSAPQ